MWTADAHCHLTDPRIFSQADDWIRKLMAENIRGFLLGGVDPSDWIRQRELAARWPGIVWISAGLHPYFVAHSQTAALNEAFAELTSLLHQPNCSLSAIGEIGLDFRSDFLNEGPTHQSLWFEKQLELAREYSKPVILHIVRAHEPALSVLEGFNGLKGMVHAFNSTSATAEKYLKIGFYLSIGAAVLFEKAEALRKAVRQAPLERLLIESDAPDQAPPGQEIHDSSTVWRVAAKIAEIRELEKEAVVAQTRQNLADFMGRSV